MKTEWFRLISGGIDFALPIVQEGSPPFVVRGCGKLLDLRGFWKSSFGLRHPAENTPLPSIVLTRGVQQALVEALSKDRI
jgi:hypothetical protein